MPRMTTSSLGPAGSSGFVTHVQVSLSEPTRVIVDPNSVSHRDPSLSVAMFNDANRVPQIGDEVHAIQPDNDGSSYCGRARVVDILQQDELIYLLVDWSSFVDVPAPVMETRGTVDTGGSLRAQIHTVVREFTEAQSTGQNSNSKTVEQYIQLVA